MIDWHGLKISLFYDGEREQLSRTLVMSFVYWLLSIPTWVIILVRILLEEKINNLTLAAFLTWTTTLIGFAFAQYTAGKKIVKSDYNKEV